MIDTDKLRGLIAENKLSQSYVAEQLGITKKTFYTKMKKGIFDSDEISQMMAILNIDNPVPIFFAQNVTY